MKKLFAYFIFLLLFLLGDLIFVSLIINGFSKLSDNPYLIFNVFRYKSLFPIFLNYQGLYVFVVGIIIAYFYRAKDEYVKDIHGSARWAKTGETRKILTEDRGIILGNKFALPLESKINKNITILGHSGSGKSYGFIKPNVIQCNGSMLITDPKGEVFDDTYDYLKEKGYKIKVLNLVNLKASDFYNPLNYIKDFGDIQKLSKTIIDNTNGSAAIENDGFWNSAENSLLTALIAYAFYELPVRQKNLGSVMNLLLNGNSEKLDELFMSLKDESPAKKAYRVFMLCGDSKTRGNILIGLGVRLHTLQNSDIQSLISCDNFELENLGKVKTAIYVITSDSHRTYDFISSLFFSQVFQILYHEADSNGGKLDIPVICMLDEFCNIGLITDFSSKISSMRSRNICVSIVLQSLGQLKTKYKDEWSNIIGNCDTTLFLGTQDTETAKYISERLGKGTVSSKSRSYSTPNGHGYGSKTESDSKAGRYLLNPDEVMRLDNREIIFVNGLFPIPSKKFDLKYHPAFKSFKKACHNLYKSEYIINGEVYDIKENKKEPTKKSELDEIKPKFTKEKPKEENKYESRDIFEMWGI